MALQTYGVLRGTVVDHKPGTAANPHFQLHAVDSAGTHYRVAINVKSDVTPSELEYLIDSAFAHPILADVAVLRSGWTALERKSGGVALDFIRANLFDRERLRTLPFDVPGPDNDLNEKLALYVRRAIAGEGATAFAFGERWPTEATVPDKEFGFKPGNGVHDIHMNQSNVGSFVKDDGVWQDGALLLHFPGEPEQWVAVFLKFQSQGWHTDDLTGHKIAGPGDPPDGRVRIVAALVNAVQTPEVEFVTLLNTTDAAIDLGGWTLADRDGHTMALSGSIPAGETLRIQLTPRVTLPNRGGTISLLDASGLKVDGVAYTGEQAIEPGRTIAL
jgi:uncharacterized protein YukJ